MIDMSEIWKKKAEELKAIAKKQFMETGHFNSVLADKASKMMEASEACK